MSKPINTTASINATITDKTTVDSVCDSIIFHNDHMTTNTVLAPGQVLFNPNTGAMTIYNGSSFRLMNRSKEEENELASLEIEHKKSIKIEKLNIFKKLSSENRQFVINNIIWNETLSRMNSVALEPSERLKSLRNRTLSTDAVTLNYAHSVNKINFAQSLLPDDMEFEDLKQAHLEASLEEEMLDGSN
jgi:hypothetical protein